VALGLASQHQYQWSLAAKQFLEALRLAPSDVEAHVQYGRNLLYRGQTAEALQQFQLARRDDPASPLVLSWVADAYFLLGARDSALSVSRKSRQSASPNFSAYRNAAHIMIFSGMRDSARALVDRMTTLGLDPSFELGLLGDSAAASALIRRNRPRQTHLPVEAALYLGVGDTARALTELSLATDRKDIWPEYYSLDDPMFDAVRGSPRFRTIAQRVGLPVNVAGEARSQARR
jgi:tetratricopeptide (TPR) repeat protein